MEDCRRVRTGRLPRLPRQRAERSRPRETQRRARRLRGGDERKDRVVPRPVTDGVDTHLDVHVAAALDANGTLLGVESFPAERSGYAALHRWFESFGELARV